MKVTRSQEFLFFAPAHPTGEVKVLYPGTRFPCDFWFAACLNYKKRRFYTLIFSFFSLQQL